MSSLALNGNGVSRGIAVGNAHLLQRNQLKVREYIVPPSLVDNEVERFNEAVTFAKAQLSSILDRIPPSTPVDIVSFIDTHLLMMSDRALSLDPVNIIRERGCNAEWALKLQRDALVAVFEEMDDAYLRTRKDDVDYVVNRIQRILLNQDEVVDGVGEGGLEGCILIADDLAPADTVTMQHEGIAAFVTEYGGPTSHTTILARSLGIPAVVGVKNVMRYFEQGEPLVVDGEAGVVIAGPTDSCADDYRKRKSEQKRHTEELCKLNDKPAISADGVAVSLYANIELPEDLTVTTQVAAKGVGLYRTEYMFMNRPGLPCEEEQYTAYRIVAKKLNGIPLTIRTMDLGADKALHPERRHEPRGTIPTNPALGLRAVRLCLRDSSIFEPQLRAILRVSARYPVSIMIPMLSSLQELLQVKAVIEQAKKSLRESGIAYDDKIAVGAMIEVPAAALSADVFAKHLDFFSIGTNDLVQYTLAADRLDNTVNYLYQPTHPAVLRLIAMTLEAGRNANIPVAMCGEMAGDPRYTRLLLGMGLREFSMQPSMVPEVKVIVQRSDVEFLTEKVKIVSHMPSAVEVEAYIDGLNSDLK
ncbi:phosphoenolpyruvate--protein phosphotransferase [Pseudomonadota bacterium]